jgi:ATP-dependent protease ClpP protease subunit
MEEYEDMHIHQGITPVEEVRGKAYHFYLSGPIGPADNYTRLVHTLKSCGPSDLVYLHINSPGGLLWSAVQIIHAISATRGTVITCAEGEVASGASLIFFAGHGMEVGEFSSVMAHDASGGSAGSLADQQQGLLHIRDVYHNLCKAVYGPFLTKKELEKVAAGGTVFLTGAQTRKRVEDYAKKSKGKVK